jgi:F420H(2)-dependent quinone reductase
MTLTGFEAALDHTNEIELTTTGRVTGKPISCPVWFVKRGGKLYLVPGDGTDSQWYKNLLKTPAVAPSTAPWPRRSLTQACLRRYLTISGPSTERNT